MTTLITLTTKKLTLLAFVTCLMSCSAALPEKDLAEEVRKSAQQSKLNSEKSEIFLKEAEDNLQQAKQLLQEANVSLAKAQLASKLCHEAQSKIAARKKRAATQKATATGASVSGYSPSDAPLPHQQQK